MHGKAKCIVRSAPQ